MKNHQLKLTYAYAVSVGSKPSARSNEPVRRKEDMVLATLPMTNRHEPRYYQERHRYGGMHPAAELSAQQSCVERRGLLGFRDIRTVVH
jgi:hypothetical protein